MIRHVTGITLLLLLLSGCSDDGSLTIPPVVTPPEPDPTAVSGGGVKGPLINASASLFLLDLAAADLKGTVVSSGTTNESAALQGITIPAGSQDSFLLEITTTAETIDLTSDEAPIFSAYRTVVSAEEIRTGQAFATPVTTLAIELALQSGPFANNSELAAALTRSASQVISTLGFGLEPGTNPFTSNPLLTSADTTTERQTAVLSYRVAIEGMAAVLKLLADEITLNNAGTTTPADEVLEALALDLSDGEIDGASAAGAVSLFSTVVDLSGTIATDPALLMIPGTTTPITRVAETLVSEITRTGITVATDEISSGTVAFVPRRAQSKPDIDSDGIPDKEDAFPSDPTEFVDTDGDGTGNNADDDDDGDGALDADDAFPLLADESLDTDGDGIGNNADEDDDADGTPDTADAFPLDANEIADTDGDGIGNNADTDDDGDGTDDVADAFPLDASEQLDTDDDGVGNNTDEDDDGDGIADVDDNLPLDLRASVATSKSIGPEGGSITSPDGLMTLTFPANAVTQATQISVGKPLNEVTGVFSRDDFTVDGHYLLEPEGLQFSEPVEMRWTNPTDSPHPNAIRMVYSLSNGVGSVPEDVVINNPMTGEVTANIRHFSDLFVISTKGVLGINQPSATVGNTLTWTYNFELQNNDYSGIFKTEGVFLDGEELGGITKQPEILTGDTIISPPRHGEVVYCDFLFDEGDDKLRFDCNPSTSGNITATCLDGSEQGLRARMGFNFEFERKKIEFLEGLTILVPKNALGYFFFPEERALLRVEADGICRTTMEIAEPRFISIGNDVDRITEVPEGVVLDECAGPYHAVVSNTRTSIVNTSGCSRDLDFAANANSIFGGIILRLTETFRLMLYGESGMFILELINGIFGELSDFTSTTTDAQYAVNDHGSQISEKAYTVANTGYVKLRTLLSNGSTTNEIAFNAFSKTGKAFIGYAPISSTKGIGITSASTSRAYFVDLTEDTATEIGTVGDTALGISCERLACDAGATSCGVTNTETVGCAVGAYGSEELYTFTFPDALTHPSNTPTFNFSTPIPGIKTASPYTRSNAAGQLVTATVNDNEIGRVHFSIRDANGTEVGSAEFFLTEFTGTTGFTGTGSSIVMMEPSAEYPNGAVRIGVKNPNDTNDGILTIPVTEALLGTSPVPFFGAPFAAE